MHIDWVVSTRFESPSQRIIDQPRIQTSNTEHNTQVWFKEDTFYINYTPAKEKCIYIMYYIGTQPKCTRQWKQSSAIKLLLEALLLAIRMPSGMTTDVIWRNGVTSEPSQSSCIRVSLFKDLSVLLNICKMYIYWNSVTKDNVSMCLSKWSLVLILSFVVEFFW